MSRHSQCWDPVAPGVLADQRRAGDEMRREHPVAYAEGPLVCNRRVMKEDVRVGDHHIRAGERVSLMWIWANLGEAQFERADEIDLERDNGRSLLYGAGLHRCPGAPLARMEMRIAIEALLDRSRSLRHGRRPPLRMVYPANGFRRLHIRLD